MRSHHATISLAPLDRARVRDVIAELYPHPRTRGDPNLIVVVVYWVAFRSAPRKGRLASELS
jgi:hypothetical protein